MAPPRSRFRRGKAWRRYVPDVVEQVRALIEGTDWPEAYVAKRVGIGVATVNGWKRRHCWRRPVGASVSTRTVPLARSGFTRHAREGLRRVEQLAMGEAARLADARPVDPAALTRAVVLIVRTQRALRPPGRRSGGR